MALQEHSSGCPACGSTAFYRYGRAVNGKKRRICLICSRQYVVGSASGAPADRPSCPVCGQPMHRYMRGAQVIRYRCSNYPSCRNYLKITPGEASGNPKT